MYEIEIKSLLGSSENASSLRKKLTALDSNATLVSQNKQLNHYFIGADIDVLHEKTAELFSKKERDYFKKVITEGKDFSVRTRLLNDTVLLVVKASIDDTTSENGISRIEFESEVKITLGELDALLLDSGFSYQAKWSREREEYVCKGVNVCLDKNAGYGYLAEFEKIVDDTSVVESVQRELRALMQELGVEELAQDRLERMFTHYNNNWGEYYGTDKIFVIE